MPARGARTESLVNAAIALGVHRNTLAGWIKQGCPVVTEADRARGVEWEISLPEVIDWRIRTAVENALSSYDDGQGQISRDEADRRRAVAQAITAEVDADQALQTVVGRAEAEADIAAFCAALRSGLSNAAAKIAARSVSMATAPEIQELVLGEMNRAFDTAEADLTERWSEDADDPTGGGHRPDGGRPDQPPP